MKKFLLKFAMSMLTLAPMTAFACDAGHQSLDDALSQTKDLNLPFTQLAPEQKSSLIAKKGLPPHVTDNTFDAWLLTNADKTLGMVMVFKDGCEVDQLGPAPMEAISPVLDPENKTDNSL